MRTRPQSSFLALAVTYGFYRLDLFKQARPVKGGETMANPMIQRPRCGVCGDFMLFALNRYIPLELVLFLNSRNIPCELVQQFTCERDHKNVWHVILPGNKHIWVD